MLMDQDIAVQPRKRYFLSLTIAIFIHQRMMQYLILDAEKEVQWSLSVIMDLKK